MKTTKLLLTLLGATALAVAAQATLVKLNTSSLDPLGTYYVDFQLNDGSGTLNGNNSATISNFNFGSGGATGDINTNGGVTGDLFSTVTLTDTSFINEFYQSFTPGSLLTFELLLSNNPDAPAPDAFSFALLDADYFNLGTFSLNTDQFLTVDLTGGTLNYQTFAGVGGIPAPSVPETGSTLLLASLALFGLAGIRRRLGRTLVAA